MTRHLEREGGINHVSKQTYTNDGYLKAMG